jgi:hypothetical protein
MPLRCFAISVILAAGPFSSAQQICPTGTPSGPVQAPVFVTNLTGQTSWFASPVVYALEMVPEMVPDTELPTCEDHDCRVTL